MGKIKDYITKNKKIVIPVAIIVILLLIGGIYLAVQANSDNMDLKADINPKQEMKETEKADKKDLTAYVKGLKNWTVETKAKNIDFLKDVTYDKKVVKEIIVDTSKVDLSKEGKYTLTYSIIPVDNSISKQTVIKTVTVEVISKEKAQKEADKGKQVITSNNEVKKDSNDHTPTPKKNNSNQNNANTTDNSNTQNTNTNSNSKSNNNDGSSKLSTNNNSGNSNSNGTKPVKPQKPKHEHNFIYVPAKTHTEYEIVTHKEEVPVYTTVSWYECNICHEHFNNDDDALIHCMDVCDSTYSYHTDDIQTGTQTVTTEEKVPHEVIDVKAHYECSCGEKHD